MLGLLNHSLFVLRALFGLHRAFQYTLLFCGGNTAPQVLTGLFGGTAALCAVRIKDNRDSLCLTHGIMYHDGSHILKGIMLHLRPGLFSRHLPAASATRHIQGSQQREGNR